MDRKLRMSELNRVSVETFKKQEKFPIVLMLDNVRSALNVGSAFRTADAFNVEQILLIGNTPTPIENQEMRKTALGGTESVDWFHFDSIELALEKFVKENYVIYGIEQTENAEQLHHWKPSTSEKTVLIFGNEVSGVSNKALKFCNTVLEIPQFGTKHSLNISVSLGVVLWHKIKTMVQ